MAFDGMVNWPAPAFGHTRLNAPDKWDDGAVWPGYTRGGPGKFGAL
jgi:hypothetical protein